MASSLPSDPADRRKLLIVASVLAACALWLSFYFLSQVSFRGRDRTLDTPGWKVASDTYEKLITDTAFGDVALKVDTEKPLKIIVIGEVTKQADLDRLPDVLKSLNPDAEYDIQVEVRRH